ncbi:hypothetical protein ACP0HM_03795 [Escherichia coli]
MNLYPAVCSPATDFYGIDFRQGLRERYELFLALLALPASGACRFGKKI